MKMKRLIYLLILTFTLPTFFISCTNSHVTKPIGRPTTTSDIPSHLKTDLLKNVKIDAEIEIPKNVNMKSIEILNAEKYDVSDLKTQWANLLLENSRIMHTENHNETGNHSNYTTTVYQTADGKNLYVGGENVSYTTDEWINGISQVFRYNSSGTAYNANQYSKTENLDFMSQLQAAQQIEANLKTLGIDTSSYDVYSLDQKTLQAQAADTLNDAHLQSGTDSGKSQGKSKSQWGTDDECYFFTFYQNVNGIQVSPTGYNLGTPDALPGSQLSLCYSKRGFEYLLINGFYKVLKSAKDTSIVSINDALKAIKAKYNSMIQQNPINIKNIDFIYLPIYSDKEHNTLQLLPVWRFKAVESIPHSIQENTLGTYYYLYVDASSGNLINTIK